MRFNVGIITGKARILKRSVLLIPLTNFDKMHRRNLLFVNFLHVTEYITF